MWLTATDRNMLQHTATHCEPKHERAYASESEHTETKTHKHTFTQHTHLHIHGAVGERSEEPTS